MPLITRRSSTRSDYRHRADYREIEEARDQQQRLAHARIPLDQAVGDAVRNNNGYRAVEVIPTVDRAGKPVASVTLMNGDDVKEAVEALE